MLKIKENGNRLLPWGMLSVSFIGFCLFYLVPFLAAFLYSMWDNPINREYCGFKNYRELFQNPYFLRGLKNTAVFMAVSIPLNVVLSFVVASAVRSIKRFPRFFSLVFLIPYIIPSATSAFFWKNFFSLNGTLNQWLAWLHMDSIDWLNSRYSMGVIVLLFLWKNVGYNMTLFLSGLENVPGEYYEYAAVEGAGRFWKFRHVTLVYLTPTSFLVLIMSLVNSFRVFKEIYIITGEYPPEGLYVLQHFMNNMFLSLDYSRLTSAVYILTAMIVFLVVILFLAERKVDVQ